MDNQREVLLTMHRTNSELWSQEADLNNFDCNEDDGLHLDFVNSDHEENPIVNSGGEDWNGDNLSDSLNDHNVKSNSSSSISSLKVDFTDDKSNHHPSPHLFHTFHPSTDQLTKQNSETLCEQQETKKPPKAQIKRKSKGKDGRITLKIRKVTRYRRKADGLDESYDCYQVYDAPHLSSKSNEKVMKPPGRENSGNSNGNRTDRKRKAPDLAGGCDASITRPKQYNLAILSNPVQSCLELSIRDLPKEVLLKIFKNLVIGEGSKAMLDLYTLSQVCEEWRQIILSTETLWQTIDFSCMKQTSVIDFLKFCEIGVVKFAKHLTLTGWNDVISTTSLSHLLRQCSTNLKSVNLRECYNIDGQSLALFGQHCPHLEELDLSRVSDTFTQSPNKRSKNPVQTPLFPTCFQQFLAQNGSNLRSLTLSENKIFKINVVVDAITEHCKNLQALDLSNIVSQSSFALSLDTLQESCPKLKILRLGNIQIKSPKGICSGFPLLEELSIPCNNSDTGHSENVISCFTHSAENLKLLDIRGSPKVTSSCLIKIPAWNLQHLAIDNCLAIFSNGLDMVVSKWKHSLIELDVSHNNHQDGISAALDLIASEKNNHLKSITLRGSSVSFESISKLVLNCCNLKMIDLQSCRALPRGTKRVFRGQEVQEFREEIIKGSYI